MATVYGVVFTVLSWIGRPPPASRPADDHAIPAEAAIGFVAGRRMERDQHARAVLIEAGTLAIERQRDALAENALSVGSGDNAKIRVDQQHARLVAVAAPHALHEGAPLRLPVEMDGEHPDRRAVGLAAGAD